MSQESSRELKKAIEDLELRKTNDLRELTERLQAAYALFHEFAARQIEPVLNVYLAGSPAESSSLTAKRRIAQQANAIVRSLGVCMWDRDTNSAVHLMADAGHDPVHGRFQLRRTDDGSNNRMVRSSVRLEKLLPLTLRGSPSRYRTTHAMPNWGNRERERSSRRGKSSPELP